VKSINQTPQNKFLTNLSVNVPKLSSKNQIDLMLKMCDGFMLKANNVPDVKALARTDGMILGFIEKLKQPSIFPDGRDNLEQILFDSKVHLIKLIASGESNLQPVHLMALYLYTSNFTIYTGVNKALSNWNANTVWHKFVGCLYQALVLIPEYAGEVYRAVDCKFDASLFTPGKQVQWAGFSLACTEWKECTKLINERRGIVFIIQSRTGKPISKYTGFPADSEVVFLPGSKFIVKALYHPSIFALGQANIRNTTYAITDSDIEKASSGTASIIVELEEIIDVEKIDN
jgi:hypothetical protein